MKFLHQLQRQAVQAHGMTLPPHHHVAQAGMTTVRLAHVAQAGLAQVIRLALQAGLIALALQVTAAQAGIKE